MASPDFPEPPASIPPTSVAECDAMLQKLSENTRAWVETGIPERIELLRRTIAATLEEADGWVATACRAKGIAAGNSQAGEEWLAGPVTFVRNLRLLVEALEAGSTMIRIGSALFGPRP